MPACIKHMAISLINLITIHDRAKNHNSLKFELQYHSHMCCWNIFSSSQSFSFFIFFEFYLCVIKVSLLYVAKKGGKSRQKVFDIFKSLRHQIEMLPLLYSLPLLNATSLSNKTEKRKEINTERILS